MLDKILSATKERTERAKFRLPLGELEEIVSKRKKLEVESTMSIFSSHPTFFAEIKFQSPSGAKSLQVPSGESAVQIARQYIDAGADAISILTEPHFFSGNFDFFFQVRKEFPQKALLLKDFIFDEYQILQGCALGASFYLLIADVLSDKRLGELVRFGLNLGMVPLVEAHDRESLLRSNRTPSPLVGVNNRNLRTLSVDIKNSLFLAKHLDPMRKNLSESGLGRAETLQELFVSGYDGFLIGSQLMSALSPGVKLKKLRRKCI